MRAEQMLEVLAGVAPSAPEGFDALADAVRAHRHRLTSCILVLLAWDEARRAFVDGLRRSGSRGPRAPCLCLVRKRSLTEPRPACSSFSPAGSKLGLRGCDDIAPPGSSARVSLFWGWQTGTLLIGIPLAVLVEALRWSTFRLELRQADLARIADLCTLLFLGIVALLAVNRGFGRGLLGAFEWLPAVLAPILLSQLASTAGRIPLSALFRYLRKQRQRDPSLEDPLVDLGGAYLALCVISAGVANVRGPGYYAGLIVLGAWALFAVRPRHSPLALWVAAFVIAGAVGYAGQAGLSQLQTSLEAWVSDWQLRGMDADPYRSTTEIGSIGRLKLLDSIVLRVYAGSESAARLKLLHRASFTSYSGTTWLARKVPMVPVEAEADGATWTLASGTPESSVRIVTRLEKGKALLALPSGTVRISSLPAAGLTRNAIGAVQADVGGDWAQYVAESADASAGYAPPMDEDTMLPAAERAVFEQVAAELGLGGAPADRGPPAGGGAFPGVLVFDVPGGGASAGNDCPRRLRGAFEERALRVLRGRDDPSPPRRRHPRAVRHRVRDARVQPARRRLRRAGTPRARMDPRVGGRPVGRHRHHASSLVRREEDLAPIWQPVADLLRWAAFRWAHRGELEASGAWYALLAVLVAALAWRIARGKRARRFVQAGTSAADIERPGFDSEFLRVERALAERNQGRLAGEPLTRWVSRVSAVLDDATRARLDRALRVASTVPIRPRGSERRRTRSLARAGARADERYPGSVAGMRFDLREVPKGK